MAQFEYLSPEWAEEATKRLQADLTPEKMKHLTSSMLTIYTNCPDGVERTVYYRVEEGVVQEVSLQEGTPPQAEFTLRGEYETFAQISRAELKARSALMSGKLKLTLKDGAPADAILQAVANADLNWIDAPLSGHGRLELTRWLREQAVSRKRVG